MWVSYANKLTMPLGLACGCLKMSGFGSFGLAFGAILGLVENVSEALSVHNIWCTLFRLVNVACWCIHHWMMWTIGISELEVVYG